MKPQTHAITAVIAAAFVGIVATAWTQPPPDGGGGSAPQPFPPGQPRGGDPLAEHFFPPELIMHNQKAIGLKENQRIAIQTAMQKMMERFTELQWQQSAETETMMSLLNKERPDEKELLAQLDKLLNIENEIKRLHLSLMLKVRNTLTPEQQAQLREMMRPMERRPPARPAAGFNPPMPPPDHRMPGQPPMP
jgi:Spy/CpxP family protein refolding chaperone